ncbi:hypothetical protein ACC699_39920, partial [Rhizobium ruizarguesonis]
MVSPWSGQSSSLSTVGVTAAIWLVVFQWLSSGLGVYITGRLRTKWAAVHTDEARKPATKIVASDQLMKPCAVSRKNTSSV